MNKLNADKVNTGNHKALFKIPNRKRNPNYKKPESKKVKYEKADEMTGKTTASMKG